MIPGEGRRVCGACICRSLVAYGVWGAPRFSGPRPAIMRGRVLVGGLGHSHGRVSRHTGKTLGGELNHPAHRLTTYTRVWCQVWGPGG